MGLFSHSHYEIAELEKIIDMMLKIDTAQQGRIDRLEKRLSELTDAYNNSTITHNKNTEAINRVLQRISYSG